MADLIWLAAGVLLACLGLAAAVWWAGTGVSNPYDFDEHASQAMAILTPDDPALAELAERMRTFVLDEEGSHDAVVLSDDETDAFRSLTQEAA